MMNLSACDKNCVGFGNFKLINKTGSSITCSYSACLILGS